MATSPGVSRSKLKKRSAKRERASRRPLVAVALLAALAVGLLAGVYLYDHNRPNLVAQGVRVAGIDLGGLKPDAARRRLENELLKPLQRPVTVHFGKRRFTITARRAGVALDVNALVQHAQALSRSGSIITRTLRGLFGGSVNADLPAVVHYDQAAVRAFAAHIRTAVERPAQDASAQPSSNGLLVSVPSHEGIQVDTGRLNARLARAMINPQSRRSLAVPVHLRAPSVTTTQLAARYPSYIVVDRGSFTLRLYARLKLVHAYPIAVGMQGLDTPAGLWHIQWEQVDPPWYVPNSAWAGALAGKVIPPGPADPLKARFMSFDGGAGIHGIDPSEYGTIGHTASHGCIRMTIPDVIDLYNQVSVGTPVYIL